MGVHVVGELRVELDSSLWAEEEISIRCVPEKTTNDLGVPVLVQTDRGDIRVRVHVGHVEVPLSDDVVLRLYRDGDYVVASLGVPMRGYISNTDICSIHPRSLSGNRDWSREEYSMRLASALREAVKPDDPEEVAGRVFKEGPLMPGWWLRGPDRLP